MNDRRLIILLSYFLRPSLYC